MSGHSKWSTIKRQKGVNDLAKGRIFSKLAKAISLAVKLGGGGDPEANARLRMAVDAAKAANMPKQNIDRAISKVIDSGENIEEVIYEGFGPGGIGVMIEAATDNRNRTSQEIKGLFERGGGNLGGPGSVAFNFEKVGEIRVKKTSDSDTQTLTLIDMGVSEVEEEEAELSVYVPVDQTHQMKEKIAAGGFDVTSIKLVQKPKNSQLVSDPNAVTKTLTFLENLSDNEDIQEVYTNATFPEV